jgi:hypothetical protein
MRSGGGAGGPEGASSVLSAMDSKLPKGLWIPLLPLLPLLPIVRRS